LCHNLCLNLHSNYHRAIVSVLVSKHSISNTTLNQIITGKLAILYQCVCRNACNFSAYDRLSLSEKIRAGAEVSELVKRLTGRNYPVFFDNMESVDDLSNIRPTSQMILTKCVRNAELSVRAGSTAMPKAA